MAGGPAHGAAVGARRLAPWCAAVVGAACGLLGLCSAGGALAQAGPGAPPAAPRAGPRPATPTAAPALAPPLAEPRPVTLSAHGRVRTDPYAWLRNRDDPAVLAYLEAENRYAEAFMQPHTALLERLYQEMLARIEQDDETVPYRHGPYLYWSRWEAGKQYPVHLRRRADSAEAPPETVLDENALADGSEYLAVGTLAPSPDHRLLAYTVDVRGDERYELRVRELPAGRELPVGISEVAEVVWASDSRTLYYTVLDAAHRPYRVMAHTLGAPAGGDRLVYEERDPAFYLDLERTRSGRFIVLSAQSADTTELWLLDAQAPRALPFPVTGRRKGVECALAHQGEQLYLLTNADGAFNFKLLRAPLAELWPAARQESPGNGAPPVRWQEVIPHRPEVLLERLEAFARHLVVLERQAGQLQVRVLQTGPAPAVGGKSGGEGAPGGEPPPVAEHRVRFDEPCYTVGFGPNPEYDTEVVRLEYTSLTTPETVYDYDLARRRLVLRKRRRVPGYDPARYVAERLWARAPDGVEVPVSLVRRRDRDPHGRGPLYLYGYGAYGIPSDPWFSAARLSLLERGFAFAIAHVRGGGELGRRWYEAGKLEHKPNTFTDFIACAEELIARRYTRPERLVIAGGSAGGLLIGAVLNLRPELFGAAVAEVPFVDVLDTMSDPSLPLTVTEYDEWGDPLADPQTYDRIAAFSPYDNVRPQRYPPLLVTAGLHDPRVGYWEAAKWVARLRATRQGEQPLLLRVDMGTGHLGASGRFDALREQAFEYAFVLVVLGLGD
ncbi:MAG: oligopeptidase B [Planctomycetota bacterium]|nr:MAG: oligopeptidase B [Planctomycetota bacterium]